MSAETEKFLSSLHRRYDPFPGGPVTDDLWQRRLAVAGYPVTAMMVVAAAAAETLFYMAVLYWFLVR